MEGLWAPESLESPPLLMFGYTQTVCFKAPPTFWAPSMTLGVETPQQTVLALQRADTTPLMLGSATTTQFPVVHGLSEVIHSFLLHVPRSHV